MVRHEPAGRSAQRTHRGLRTLWTVVMLGASLGATALVAAVPATTATADTASYSGSCTSSFVSGGFTVTGAVTTGTLSARPVPLGGSETLNGYGITVTAPASLVNAAIGDGLTSLSGTVTTAIDATNISPATTPETLTFITGTLVSGQPITVSTAPLSTAPTFTDATGVVQVKQGTSVDLVLHVDTISVPVSCTVPSSVIATSSPPVGYDLVGSDGGVFVFPKGGSFYGSLPGLKVTANDIVGIVPTRNYHGYDLVGADGGVFVFPVHSTGGFYGSLPSLGVKPAAPIVGIVPNATDTGYFLVGRDGGVFAFDTSFAGSLPGIGVHVDDVVGIAATADDKGYWVVEADGVVHGFGDATVYSKTGGSTAATAVGISATPDGLGYWVVYSNGAVAAYGDASYQGAPSTITAPIVSLVPTSDGQGYWLIGRDGNVYNRGDAVNNGSLPALKVAVDDVVGAAPTVLPS